jgi:hypothetical protein
LDSIALRWEKLNNQNIGPSLEELEAGQHQELKDITEWSPTCKSYWVQWKSLAVSDGILKHHWDSTDRQSKIAPIVLPWSKMKDVLT